MLLLDDVLDLFKLVEALFQLVLVRKEQFFGQSSVLGS